VRKLWIFCELIYNFHVINNLSQQECTLQLLLCFLLNSKTNTLLLGQLFFFLIVLFHACHLVYYLAHTFVRTLISSIIKRLSFRQTLALFNSSNKQNLDVCLIQARYVLHRIYYPFKTGGLQNVRWL
jgi:uncharacterized membrane protein